VARGYNLDLILDPVWTVRMVEEVEHWFNAAAARLDRHY
jgi:hypothetical protein